MLPNSSPIGVFDSGVGGLSVWRELIKLLPNESTIYFADSANCPYGEKSPSEIIKLAEEITIFLLDKGAKLIVVACNTVTAASIDYLRSKYDVPFVGMEPAVKQAAQLTKTGNIGILATKGTFDGNHYKTTSRRHASEVKQHLQVGKGLVELVENGDLDSPNTEKVIRPFLEPMLKAQVDQLVLGCTHYPFLIPAMQKLVKDQINIIDPAPAIARRVQNLLKEHNLENKLKEENTNLVKHQFYNSLDAKNMISILEMIGIHSPKIQILKAIEANAFYHSKTIFSTKSYRLIRDYYGEKKAERSQVPLIQHIHEGLTILEELGVNLATQEAYCLHPIFQADEALHENYLKSYKGIDNLVILLALEYRNIANQYLSKREIQTIDEINLSPLKEVNLMLVADKVQNRKDFEIYHLQNHPRSKELQQYFRNWLQRLEISEEKYQELVAKIN
jgi:glutamate racemase